jgi:adenosylcobyric acid synthase
VSHATVGPATVGTALRGALLVAGTTSDAGKSALVAGICRWLARQGVSVAPFKAQNMSNNSVVTADGGEIGRAQAMQAHACGLEPSVAFNPVLLKPGSDRSSQVVVLGRAQGTVSAMSYRERKAALLEVVTATLADLRSRYDVVVCEGAGSPAEINLRATDIANMGLAQAADLPVVVVGDIDRGGVLAHLFGTVAVLSPADQARIAGFVVNKFRGDPALLAPGLDQLRALTGRPTLGVVPWADGLWLDAEDSLAAVTDGVLGRPAPAHGAQWLRVAVIRFPRISNATDAEALACEPGVAVRYVTEPSRIEDADLVVLPGSKATVADLAWLRRTGLADAVVAHAKAGRPVLGICGGYQMLGRVIADPHGVEGGSASACSTSTSSSRPTRCWRTRRAPRGGTRCAGTRSTTAGWCARETHCFWTARDRTRAPSSARTGTGCSRTTGSGARCWSASRSRRAAPGSGSRPTRRSPPSAPLSSTCSAISSRTTSTPRPCGM